MIDPELRDSLLKSILSSTFQKLVCDLPYALLRGPSELLHRNESIELLDSLEQLSKLIQKNKWIVGDAKSLADIAVAAQLSLLSFPKSYGDDLAGKGCPGFHNHPQLQDLFNWRDQLVNN